jgi:hypothetical protein
MQPLHFWLTCDVLQEQQGDLALAAQLHKVCSLEGGLREQHAVVGYDPDRLAIDCAEACRSGAAAAARGSCWGATY